MNNFAQACILSNEEWIDSFPSEITPYKYSKQHNRKMQKLFSKMRKDKYHKYTKNTMRVLIVAAIISSMTITAFGIPQSREFIIKKLFDYSSYTIKNIDDAAIVSDLIVGYIPDGFQLSDHYESNSIYSYEYYKDSNFIVVNKYALDNEVNFDTEMFEYEKILVDNITYIFYQSQIGMNGILWNENGYIYSIKGNIKVDILFEMALKTK